MANRYIAADSFANSLANKTAARGRGMWRLRPCRRDQVDPNPEVNIALERAVIASMTANDPERTSDRVRLRSGFDAVDGSSTGTRVPRKWALFEAPTILRSNLCRR